MEYAVSCDCGRSVMVRAGDAGAIKSCDCGLQLQIPPLSELREQPSVTKYSILARLGVLGLICLIWGGLFFASLSLAKLDLGHFQDLCGPWGCLPESAPLISVHAMWFTLVFGASWLSGMALPRLRNPSAWGCFTGMAMLVMVLVLAIDTYEYLERGGAFDFRLWGYKLVMHTDLPLTQCVIAGAVNWIACLVRVRRDSHADTIIDASIG